MHRRALTLPAMLVAVVVAIGACGGGAPPLSDPTEILTKAVEALQKVKAVRLEAAVDGTVKLDPTGTGQATDISVAGTKLTGDVNVESGDLQMSLEVPALLGLTADFIVVGEDSYVRTSFTGDKYQKGTAAAPGLPVNPPDPQQGLTELQTWLKRPEVGPRKLADASCASRTCYQVEIDLSADDLRALLPDLSGLGTPGLGTPGLGTPGLGDATVLLTVLVEKDTLRPVSITAKLTATQMGDVSLTLTLSNWDEALNITAPPADQVQ